MLGARELQAWCDRLEAEAQAKVPAGARVSAFTVRQYAITGGAVFCPEDRELCRDKACCMGTRCGLKAAAIGLQSDGTPLPHRERPVCSARTRAGGECQIHAEPGKRRCRLHGGKSTGPKTTEGRERIAAAQRRRWAAQFNKQSTQSNGRRADW